MSGSGEGEEIEEDYPLKIVFYINLVLMLSIFLRQLRNPVYYCFIDRTTLMLIGFVSAHVNTTHFNGEDWNHVFDMENDSSVVVYYINVLMPIMIFDASFHLPATAFKETWPHVFLVTIPSIGFTTALFYLIDDAYLHTAENVYQLPHYLMIVSVTMLQSYRLWKRFQAEHSINSDVNAVMQTEQAFGMIISLSLYLFAWIHTQPTSETSLDMRYLNHVFGYVVSILTGICGSFVTAYWISYIPKDLSNMTTIVFVLVYLVYNTSGILGAPPHISVFVMGFLLGKKRDTLSANFLTLFNKLMEVVYTMVSCSTHAITGTILYDLAIGKGDSVLTTKDYIRGILLYILQIFVRIMMVLISWFITRRRRYIESKVSCLITAFSGFNGIINCLLAVACLHIFKHDKYVMSSIFLTIVINVVLSLLLNPILSYSIHFLQIKFSLMREKSLMLERAARFMIDTKAHAFVNLKNDAFLADADWDSVYRYTMIKDDILHEFRNKQWLKNPSRFTTMGIKKLRRYQPKKFTVANKYAIEEASKQIGKSQHEIYRQMYTEGSLNKRALGYLTSFADDVVRTSQLTKSDQIIKCTQPSKPLLWLHDCLTRSFHRQQWHHPRSVQYSILAFVDIFISMISIWTQLLNEEYPWSMVFKIHQSVTLVFFFSLLLYEIVFIEKTYVVKKYHIQTFITSLILLASATDMGYYFYIIHLKNSSKKRLGHYLIWIILSASRFLKLLKLVEISKKMETIIMSYVNESIEKEIYFTCHMTRSFLSAQMYSHKKLTAMGYPSIALHLRYMAYSQRLELKQYLALKSMQNLGVVTAYKTRLAIRITLNSIISKLNEIKNSGMINATDAETINSSIDSRIFSKKHLPNNMQPLTIEQLILSIPWVNADIQLASFILSQGKVLIYSPRDIIVTQGHMPEGLFIILFGLVRVEQSLNFRPEGDDRKPHILGEEVHRTGDILLGFLERGSIIGEKSILTGRPGHKTLVCATHVEVLVVYYKDMVRKVNPSPPNMEMSILERRMWYSTALRQAVNIMQRENTKIGLVQIKVMNPLCNAYLIDGYTNKAVSINWTETVAVILIRGWAMNHSTNANYVGPCVIPDHCSRLLCQPEKGMRVLLLVVKKTEDRSDYPVWEETMPPKDLDNMTLSSGSSIGGPVLTYRPYYSKLPNTAVSIGQEELSPEDRSRLQSLLATHSSPSYFDPSPSGHISVTNRAAISLKSLTTPATTSRNRLDWSAANTDSTNPSP